MICKLNGVKLVLWFVRIRNSGRVDWSMAFVIEKRCSFATTVLYARYDTSLLLLDRARVWLKGRVLVSFVR